jgi:D-alanine-D-alanine ligase
MSIIVKVRSKPRIVVIYNRDFEGAEADPENKAREDVQNVARGIVRILVNGGFETAELAIGNDIHAAMAALVAMKPNVVFNLCESIHGDNRFESLMPLHMDLAGIAYTGSCPFGLSLALRKEKVKDILRGCSVPVPRGGLLSSVEEAANLALAFPVIVKPAREDASVGISSASVVSTPQALEARVAYVLDHYRQPAVVEEFIEGREIYVSILERMGQEPQVFPFFEIDFSDMPDDRPKIVSFEGKWVEDSIEYKGTRPVRCEGLSPELRASVAKVAVAAFRAVGLRDYARMDIRLSMDGVPYVIDVNPNCDLSDLAGGYSRAAKAAGLSYKELILRIVELALARQSQVIAMAKVATPPVMAGPDEASAAELRPKGRAPRGGACSV